MAGDDSKVGAFGVVDVCLLLRQKFLEREAIAYRERDKERAVLYNEMHAIDDVFSHKGTDSELDAFLSTTVF